MQVLESTADHSSVVPYFLFANADFGIGDLLDNATQIAALRKLHQNVERAVLILTFIETMVVLDDVRVGELLEQICFCEYFGSFLLRAV
jgi:hypothetical protein